MNYKSALFHPNKISILVLFESRFLSMKKRGDLFQLMLQGINKGCLVLLQIHWNSSRFESDGINLSRFLIYFLSNDGWCTVTYRIHPNTPLVALHSFHFVFHCTLHTVLVPPIAVRLELPPRQAVPAKGNHNHVQKKIGGHFLVAHPFLLGDFSAAIPFLDELVFGDLVPEGDRSTGHAPAGAGCGGSLCSSGAGDKTARSIENR